MIRLTPNSLSHVSSRISQQFGRFIFNSYQNTGCLIITSLASPEPTAATALF